MRIMCIGGILIELTGEIGIFIMSLSDYI